MYYTSVCSATTKNKKLLCAHYAKLCFFMKKYRKEKMTKLRHMQEGGSASAVTQEHYCKNKEDSDSLRHKWGKVHMSRQRIEKKCND